ncbi:MAG: antitoxin [Ignavibacteriales bacterium]|nr:antitoxin [Ignavibacteriales bacterium]
MKLDKEEKELLKSYEKGKWKSVKDLEKKKSEYQRIAKDTAAKNKRINILLTERDLANLKAKSLEEGMPYQTLIASIIHKYISGKFKEI